MQIYHTVQLGYIARQYDLPELQDMAAVALLAKGIQPAHYLDRHDRNHNRLRFSATHPEHGQIESFAFSSHFDMSRIKLDGTRHDRTVLAEKKICDIPEDQLLFTITRMWTDLFVAFGGLMPIMEQANRYLLTDMCFAARNAIARGHTMMTEYPDWTKRRYTLTDGHEVDRTRTLTYWQYCEERGKAQRATDGNWFWSFADGQEF